MASRWIVGSIFFAVLMALHAGTAFAQGEGYGNWAAGGANAPFAGQFGYQPGMGGEKGIIPGSAGDPGQMPAMPNFGSPIGVPITSNKTLEIVEKYLLKTNNGDLYAARLYEYNTHFEVELKELEGQRGAFELIIDKFTGRVYPEMGPNLQWNNKYGLNGNYFGLQPVPTITVSEALGRVGEFIKRTSPDLKVEGDVTEYFGLYEFHVTQDGKLAIEVNVNGFTGQMWIENWHGSLLREVAIKGKN